MDNLIFEMKFLLKMLVSVKRNNEVDLHSLDFHATLWGMDFNQFHKKIDSLKTYPKEDLIPCSELNVQMALFPQEHLRYQNITDEQMRKMTALMTYLLKQEGRSFMKLLVQLIVVFLQTNKKAECEAWVGKHFALIAYFGSSTSGSILDVVNNTTVGDYVKKPLLDLLKKHSKRSKKAMKKCKTCTPVQELPPSGSGGHIADAASPIQGAAPSSAAAAAGSNSQKNIQQQPWKQWRPWEGDRSLGHNNNKQQEQQDKQQQQHQVGHGQQYPAQPQGPPPDMSSKS